MRTFWPNKPTTVKELPHGKSILLSTSGRDDNPTMAGSMCFTRCVASLPHTFFSQENNDHCRAWSSDKSELTPAIRDAYQVPGGFFFNNF